MRPFAVLMPALLGAALATLAAAQAPDPPPQGPAGPRPFAVVAPAIAADSAPTPTPPTPTAPAACGPRPAARSLADPAPATIDPAPAAGSVAALLALDRPPGLGDASPRQAPLETRPVALEAWLRGAIRSGSGGVELLLSTSPDGPLLRAAFPAPECQEGASPADRAAMEAARIAFLGACGVPPASQWKPLGGHARFVAIPFWGQPRPSGSDGAPSGIELAPVLAFQPPAEGCSPDQSPGPTPTPTPGAPLQLLIHLDPFRNVARGTEVTVTIIVQTVPEPGGTPAPGPAGILCRYQAFDRLGQTIASGGPAPTGPDGTVQFRFTIPQEAAIGTPSEPGSVVPRCEGLVTPGGARLEVTG